MKQKEKRGTHKVLWGFIYVTTFLVVFIVSAIVKMTYDPFHGAYKADWSESVGIIHVDVDPDVYGSAEMYQKKVCMELAQWVKHHGKDSLDKVFAKVLCGKEEDEKVFLEQTMRDLLSRI